MYHFLSSSGPNEPMYRCENNSRMLLQPVNSLDKSKPASSTLRNHMGVMLHDVFISDGSLCDYKAGT